jgi:hypothetical protein
VLCTNASLKRMAMCAIFGESVGRRSKFWRKIIALTLIAILLGCTIKTRRFFQTWINIGILCPLTRLYIFLKGLLLELHFYILFTFYHFFYVKIYLQISNCQRTSWGHFYTSNLNKGKKDPPQRENWMLWLVGTWSINALWNVGSCSFTRAETGWNTRGLPEGLNCRWRGPAPTEETQPDGFHVRIVGGHLLSHDCVALTLKTRHEVEARAPTSLGWNHRVASLLSAQSLSVRSHDRPVHFLCFKLVRPSWNWSNQPCIVHL